MDARDLDRIKHNTRSLLGLDVNVDYITEPLLAEMALHGVEITDGEAVNGLAYYAVRVVDAVEYVAFDVDVERPDHGVDRSAALWLRKPVEVHLVERSDGGSGDKRYLIRKLPESHG